MAGHSRYALLLIVSVLAVSSSAGDAILAKTYPRGAAKKLIVETDAGAVKLQQPIDGPISVDVSPAAKPGDDCRVTQSLQGGTLRLSAHAAKDLLFRPKSCSAGFKVSGYFAEVEVRSGSGDVSLGILSRKASIKTGSGAINVRTTSDLVLRTGSGAISGEAAGAKLEIATGSGDVNLAGLTGLVKAKSGSGAIQLDWTEAPPSGTIEVGTGSGNFAASFPKGTKLKTSVRSAAGSIHDDFDDKDAKLALDFKSGSGDASVTRRP